MATLKGLEWRHLESLFNMNSGYVLNFSNAEFSEFFNDEFGINIYDQKYASLGTSKRNRLKSYTNQASGWQVGKVLRALWDYRQKDAWEEAHLRSRLLTIDSSGIEAAGAELNLLAMEDEDFEHFISKIENRNNGGTIGAASVLANEFSFRTVSIEIERCRNFIDEDPEDAITASCSLLESVCKSILYELSEELPTDKSIKPLYTAAAKHLGLSPGKTDLDPLIIADVRVILSGLSNVVSGIGALRTHGGDAHGRDHNSRRIDARIARLAVDSASSLTVFLIESWDRLYPKKELRKTPYT